MFWISKFKDGDIDNLEYRKAIVDIFVNSVFLYDDKLVITFNWKDGTKTVSLAMLEAADIDGGELSEFENVLNINDFRSSHLDDNRPPQAALIPCSATDKGGFVPCVVGIRTLF